MNQHDAQTLRKRLLAESVAHDDLAVIKIEGMHCHRCEQAIKKELARHPGVREVEVDFLSGQASILYDKSRVSIAQLMETITRSGYHVTGFTQNRDGAAQTGKTEP
jgi:copper chaperone CopZ